MANRANTLGRLATAEAIRLRCDRVAPEHLLLAVVGTDGPTARVLAARGIGIGVLRTAARYVGYSSWVEIQADRLTYSPEAKQMLDSAIGIARKCGHNEITSEHLLLALLNDETGTAVAALARLGVDSDWLRREVIAEAGWSG